MKMKSVVAIVMLAVVASSGAASAQNVGVTRGVPVARVSSSARVSTSRGSLPTTSTTSRGGVARSEAAAAAPTSTKRYEESEDVFDEDEYFSVSTQRLFDADGYQDGEGNECFVDDDGAD